MLHRRSSRIIQACLLDNKFQGYPKRGICMNIFHFSSQKPQDNDLKKSLNQYRLNFSENYHKIVKICSPQLKKYITNGIITLLHAGLFMYLPHIYQDINYLMQLKISVMPQHDIITQYAYIMGKWATVFAFMGIFTYWRRFDFLDITNRIAVRMRAIAFRKIMQSQFYRKNLQFQTYIHHIITDIQTVSWFTGQTIFMGLRGFFFLIGGSICLLYESPYICLIAATTMGAFNLYYRPRNLKLKELKQLENQSLIDLSQHISERLQNIRLIKICHTQSMQQYKLHNGLQKFYQLSRNVAKANGFNYASLQALGLCSLFTIAACGSLMISFEVSNFSLITSSTYALYVAMGFRSTVFFNTQLNKILGVYKILEGKIGAIHQQPDYMKNFEELKSQVLKQIEIVQEQALQHKILKSKGLSIKFDNIDFSYTFQNGSQHVLYKNYNLTINSGDIVALIGPSGVGKSTLFNLITKLSEPNNGNIFIDDMPLHLMDFYDIQQLISYVTQQNFLFKGTVSENLSYGNQGFDCSDQNLIECLKLTNAYEFVMRKGGLNMMIQQKGKNISGGQKQRIILARALVKHPRLLLLDEATAGVDGTSQQVIVENLKRSRKDMTTIIITHKIQNFNQIVTRVIDLSENKF